MQGVATPEEQGRLVVKARVDQCGDFWGSGQLGADGQENVTVAVSLQPDVKWFFYRGGLSETILWGYMKLASLLVM